MLSLANVAWQLQVPGYVEITQPSEGQALGGVVTIQGTASHPSFQSYGVSFAYDPNPTDTWFPIGERITTPVNESRLAVWDTSGLSPGTYQLRLTVYLKDGRSLQATIHGLTVGKTATLAAPAVIATSTAVPLAAQAQPGIPAEDGKAVAATPPSPAATLLQVLRIGAFSAIAALILLAIYAFLRPRMRVYLGSMQNRRLDPRRGSRRRGGRP
jgi:hypothetical protein